MPVPKFPCPLIASEYPHYAVRGSAPRGHETRRGDSIPDTPFNQMESTEREQILIEHLPVVRYIARRIHEHLPAHVEMDDLVSAGMVGLVDAFNKFDAGKKVQFRSYAQFRIRGAILDSLRTLDWSPRELRRKGRAIETAMHKLTGRLGRTPMENEVAAEMDMSLDEYQHLLTDLRGLEIGSLDVAHSEDSSDDEVAYVPSSPEEGPVVPVPESGNARPSCRCNHRAAGTGAPGFDSLLLRGNDDEGDRTHPGCGGVTRISDSYLRGFTFAITIGERSCESRARAESQTAWRSFQGTSSRKFGCGNGPSWCPPQVTDIPSCGSRRKEKVHG